MKIFNTLLVLLLTTSCLFAQNNLKEYRAGHTFTVSLPDYMSKTFGLNSTSSIEYKNVVKDVYGFIVCQAKEDLKLIDLNFSSINEFYELYMKDFFANNESRKVSKPKLKNNDEVNFMECDVTVYNQDVAAEIYYFIGIVETKKHYYTVISWSAADQKDKFKQDFQQILYSLKD